MLLGSLSELCTPDNLILFEPSSHKPCHRLLDISTVIPLIVSPSTQHFQPSSKLNLSPFMSISRPSTHGHRTVNVYLFDRHPNRPIAVDNDRPNRVKVAIEEDQNKAQWAWSDGPDGSISMGQRKGQTHPLHRPITNRTLHKEGIQ